MIPKPNYNDFPPYCRHYFDLVAEDDLMEALKNSRDHTLKFISEIPAAKENFSYAENKWTVKQVLSHIIDCERIYAYRALRFSRKDNTELPGFDEDLFAANANASGRNLQDLAEEYKSVRGSTIFLFEHMTEEMLGFKGMANKLWLTPCAIGFLAAGHNIHHCKIIKERYL